MISLDKKILDPNSAVAQRMIEYGKENELFIIIPDKKKEKLDLSQTVHIWSTGGCKSRQFFRLRGLGKKIISDFKFQISDCLITAQDPFFTGLIGVLLKNKFGIKLEVQVHGDFFSDYYKKQWFRQRLARWVVKRADKIRVVGERVRQSLLKLGIADEKIEVKPILIDEVVIKNYVSKINLREKYPGFEKIFLVLGRLDKIKNIAWLINLFKQVAKQKKYLLLIVGDGIEKQNIQYLISNIHNVKLESWTNDPISYIKTCDCLLFSSLSEGYGLVPMEAYAVGTPISMNDVGVANYELKPSERVKILPINDKDAWINAILDI